MIDTKETVEGKSVIVVGRANDNISEQFLVDTLNKAHAQHHFYMVSIISTHPSVRMLDSLICKWATNNGVYVHWIRKTKKEAPWVPYGRLFKKRSRSKPDLVVSFVDENHSYVKRAKGAKVEVLFAKGGTCNESK